MPDAGQGYGLGLRTCRLHARFSSSPNAAVAGACAWTAAGVGDPAVAADNGVAVVLRPALAAGAILADEGGWRRRNRGTELALNSNTMPGSCLPPVGSQLHLEHV
jgi:hypothetical protein